MVNSQLHSCTIIRSRLDEISSFMSLNRNALNSRDFFLPLPNHLVHSKTERFQITGRKKKQWNAKNKYGWRRKRRRRKFQSDYGGGKAARDTNSPKTLALTRRSSSPSTRKLMMLARRWITSDSTQSGADKWAPASLTPASTRRKTNSHVSCYL